MDCSVAVLDAAPGVLRSIGEATCSVAVLDAAPGVLRSIGELVPAALTHWQQ